MQTLADRLRRTLTAYDRAVLNASPTAVFARLHVIAPVSLLAVLVMLIVGFALPVGREQTPVLQIPMSSEKHRELKRLLDEYQGLPGGLTPTVAQQRAIDDAISALTRRARSAGLRNCGFPELDSGFSCDGRGVRDGALKVAFWLSLAAGLVCLVFWLFVQFRDSWMLPRWGAHAWYTPVYAASIAAFLAGPVVMAVVYFARASADYGVSPDKWILLEAGPAFYALGLLQVTALAVAVVEARMPAVSFAAVAAAITVACIMGYLTVLAAGPRPDRFGNTSVNTGAIVLVLAAYVALIAGTLRVTARRRRTQPASPSLRTRIGELSRILAVGWIVFSLWAVLRLAGIEYGVLTASVQTICLAVCAVHLWRSHEAELLLPDQRVSA